MLDFLVLAVGAFLPVVALPNEVLTSGLGFLGPVVLAPLFWFALRRPPWVSALGGALWVTVVTLFSQSWLLSFHPLAFPLVLLFQIPWYAAVVALVSWTHRRCPWLGPWGAALVWTFFEFLRVQGFFSFPYGALASSFWAYPVTFQSADLVGTAGITFLLAWASAWVALVACRQLPWSRLRVDLAVGLGLWTLDVGYGVFRLSEPEVGRPWHPALVQQAQDPWKGGPEAYEAGFETLKALSDRALLDHPDAIVWSETAFVPSVAFHEKYRENPDSLRLVRRLEEHLAGSPVPYLIGNDHREKADGTIHDYNAVLAWDHGWVGRYEKNRLVPFTESFPFKDQLPWVYRWLLDADTHFWQPGRGHPLLTIGGVAVGTPICFEDAFPDGARAFAQQGAEALVNLTNDAWAPGRASRMQHLSLAVFRSVETRLALVRASNDGATATISRRGEVLALLSVGDSGVLQGSVTIGRPPQTLYTSWGDWFPVVSGVLWAGCLVVPRRKLSVDKA